MDFELEEQNGEIETDSSEDVSIQMETDDEGDGICRGFCCSRRKKETPDIADGEAEKTPPPPPIPWYRLYKSFCPLHPVILSIGFTAAILNGAVYPCFSIIFGEMFDAYNEEDEDERKKQIRLYALGFLCLGFFSFLMFYLQTSITSMAGEKISVEMRKRAFAAVMRNDVPFMDRHSSGVITSRLSSDVTLVQSAVSEKVGLLVMNLAQTFIGIIIAFVFGWKMTLVLLSVTPLLCIAFAIFSKIIMGQSTEGQNNYARANSIALEAIQGFRTVLSFVREEYTIDRYDAELDDAFSKAKKKAHLLGLSMGLVNLVTFGTYGLGFWYGSTLVEDGEMSQGDVLIVFFSIIMSAMGLGQAGSLSPDLAKGAASAGVLFALINEPVSVEPNEIKGEKVKEDFPGVISFKDVDFSYPARPNAPVLRSISFDVPLGSTVAFAGQSGGGKSTILNLLLRFYDTLSGEISVGDIPLSDYSLSNYREHVGLVSQEPILFEGTVRDNIRFGKLDATDNEVEEAAKMGNAHNFIMSFPDGYNTPISHGKLSGGQKQRIAIARAILKDPKILLLDEATSALDAESEELVQEALDRLMVGRSTIVIAHRLSTIRSADRIYVLDEGAVVESGTHDELVALRRYYYALVHKQVNAAGSGDEGLEGRSRLQTLRDEMS